jgi:hypothetical protein
MTAAGSRSAAADPLDAIAPVAIAREPSRSDLDRLASAGEPVILRGLVSSWPAVEAARRSPAALNAYLKEFDRGLPAPVMEAPPGTGGRFGYAADLREYNFTKRQRPLAETLDRIERASDSPNPPFIAIQLLPIATNLPGFAVANSMPIVPDGAEPRLWLGGPVKTQIHNDPEHNLACVIAGRRRFLLFPPEQVGNLYIGPPDRSPPLSLVDPEAPDLVRFPKFRVALAAAKIAYLEPGDALLMPKYWWHHVTSCSPYNAMVNYWWGGIPRGIDNPGDGFLGALLAIKHLPESERRYWRAMFEAHIFGDGDEAMAHVPPALRAHFGEMTGFERAALRRQLRTIFSKPSNP